MMEIISGLVLTFLFVNVFTPSLHVRDEIALGDAVGVFFSHLVFITALICATRSDLEALVIPQIFTLWLVPVGVFLSGLGLTDINLYDSIIGVILGYGVLWVIAKVFEKMTNNHGLGEGDMELMALVGSFTGPIGVYYTITLGSILGLVIAGGYILTMKKGRSMRIPFAPFLSLGAVLYIFFSWWLPNII